MGNQTANRDILLVRECLSGSEHAWTDFYCRYESIVKSVVRRQRRFSPQEVEDVTQNVFISLMSGLKTYDSAYSLSNFICTIAERVSIDEYRRSKTAKRDGRTDPIDHHDGGQEGMTIILSNVDHEEEELGKAQLVELLRHAFMRLGARCRELLRLRYYEELPYENITQIIGATENTLSVQAKRCLKELRACFDEIQREGIEK